MTKEKCVVFIGPTGHGKSSTANSLIGKTVFNTSSGTTSTTTDFNSHLFALKEVSLLVVDTPDINDQMLGKSDDEIAEELFSHLPANIDAFVFIFKFGNRCTKDEVAIISTLRKMYGDSFLDLVVIVFTFGDRFEKLKQDGKYNRSFDDWLQHHAQGEIGSLLKKCDKRTMLYNNREQCENKKQSQRNNLLNVIINLKSSGESYNSSCILHENNTQEETETMKQPTDLDLLIVGKTGNGKSATGNSILGRKWFNSRSSTSSVTKDIDVGICEFEGKIIKIVDCPGVGDTRLDSEAAVQLLLTSTKYAIEENPRGYHALLLVLRFEGRFTAEDQDYIRFLKNTFGNNFLRDYGILTLTCGDVFERKSEETGQSLQEWCREQDGILKELLNECCNRIVLFDNVTRDPQKKHDQVVSLIKAIENLRYVGHRYRNVDFERAKDAREKLIIEGKKSKIEEKATIETSLILQKFQEFGLVEDLKERENSLLELKTRAKTLHEAIKSEDKGTGILGDLLDTTKNILISIEGDITFCSKMAQERERIKHENEETRRQLEAKFRKENILISLEGDIMFCSKMTQKSERIKNENEENRRQLEAKFRKEIELERHLQHRRFQAIMQAIKVLTSRNKAYGIF